MTVGPAAARFVDPEGVRELGNLLRRAKTTLESEIRGPSMEPTLPHGCRIRIEAGRLEACVPGAVAAVVAPAGLVAHRIVARTARHLLTRGDASTACDPPVPLDRVMGPVAARSVDGRWSPLPPRPAGSVLHRLLSFCNYLDVRVALGVHPALGRLAAMRGLRLRNFIRRWRGGPG